MKFWSNTMKFVGQDGKPHELNPDMAQVAFVEGGAEGSGETVMDILGPDELRSLLKWAAVAYPGLSDDEALNLLDWPGWQAAASSHHLRTNAATATTRELLALLKLQ